MGVTKVGNRKYRARYSANGVRYSVGTFNTKKAANDALADHMWNNPKYPGYITGTAESKPVKVVIKRTWLGRVVDAISNLRSNSKY